MHRTNWLAGTACWWMVAMGTPAVSAQPRDPAAPPRDPATAEALFRQGRQAMEAKNYREACPKFAESERLEPAAGTLMNLATCEEKLGKLASAWQHWKEAIDALPANDDRVSFARGRVNDLEKKLPKLRVTLAGGTGKVFRDEIELGPASQGVMLPVDPGAHVVTVQLQGHLPEKVSVDVSEGEEKQLEVHPGPVDPHANDVHTDLVAKPRPRTLGWVVGGIGVAGVGAAAVSGLMLVNQRSKVETLCPDKSCTTQEGVDAAATGKTLLVVNTAAWVVGAVGLGLGAYLVLSPSSSKVTTALVPAATPQGGSLACVGSF
jgi:hypothetical protein